VKSVVGGDSRDVSKNTVLDGVLGTTKKTVWEREQPGRCYSVSKKREQPGRCCFVSKNGACARDAVYSRRGVNRD
jgi:hypothetical protein